MLLVLSAGLLAIALFTLLVMQRRLGRLEVQLGQLARRLAAVEAARAPERHPAQRELAVGDAVSAFRALTTRAEWVPFQSLRSSRIVLVHWGAACPFSSELLPHLQALAPKLHARGVRVALVTPDAALTRRRLAAYDLECLVVPEEAAEPAVFAGHGTPVAYLLDTAARVERPLAVGARQVTALLRHAAGERSVGRPLETSRLRRDGLRVGEPVPGLALADVEGGVVRLTEYRGRRLLVVLSDPHCEPCRALAPELARCHAGLEEEDVALLLIGRGAREANQAEAQAHGFRFPVALQRRWEASREFGIFSTPVAFLFDAEGRVERPVAKGGAEISTLLEQLRSPATAAVAR